ncbi:ESCRT-related protein CHMP1-like isoform X1 [Cornus florida]|uniref:ESCRT-related protein CHMP1-like isoform X1 n=1 Tax=Cornus florida TaxID=4283 RepID=UPI00289A1E01|nr:ESCRT-related protein CHMP1-like isoform X1 [Cornus florida]
MNHLRMKSRSTPLVARLDTLVRITTIGKSMSSIAKSLESALATRNLQKMSETIDQFEHQFVNMAKLWLGFSIGPKGPLLPREIATSASEQELADFARQVSLYSGCSHHRSSSANRFSSSIQSFQALPTNEDFGRWKLLKLSYLQKQIDDLETMHSV